MNIIVQVDPHNCIKNKTNYKNEYTERAISMDTEV